MESIECIIRIEGETGINFLYEVKTSYLHNSVYEGCSNVRIFNESFETWYSADKIIRSGKVISLLMDNRLIGTIGVGGFGSESLEEV